MLKAWIADVFAPESTRAFTAATLSCGNAHHSWDPATNLFGRFFIVTGITIENKTPAQFIEQSSYSSALCDVVQGLDRGHVIFNDERENLTTANLLPNGVMVVWRFRVGVKISVTKALILCRLMRYR